MFIRPIGSIVYPSQRPSGRPLLRGILARGAYVWDAAQRPPETPHAPAGTDPGAVRGATPGTAPSPPAASADHPAPAASRKATADRPAAPGGSGAGAPAAAGADLTDRLTRLADLAREGLLTPEEFSAAKARLLAG
ncbi:SHOCT domain-containing protein [Streptomyces sp. ISL-43]|uniref:SHOCT domain-containing protein n=1 Tax=Streptomyces sp. ISL-43 TaxID=2819183 RepID=UPI001BEA906A|nr:SHOCT domain-containing protein [Streptomyces sp. ISL-43]MBT2448216.1 SHOCT domain-containing protein [Streptomyces sp. ISL-43]